MWTALRLVPLVVALGTPWMAKRLSICVSVLIISLIKSWNMQKQRENNNNKNIYISIYVYIICMTFFGWISRGVRSGETRKLKFLSFSVVSKERKLGQSCFAAACRKYPNTIATSRGIITCCYCWCCCFSDAVIGTVLLWLSSCRLSFKNCHTWRMRNMRNFFPKRSCCRCSPKGQAAAAAAAAVDVDVNHSAAATLRDSAGVASAPPHLLPSTSPSRPSASAGQLARNWPTLGQHGSINGVNSKRDWRRSSRDGDRGSSSGNWQTHMLNIYAKMRLGRVGGGTKRIQVQQSMYSSLKINLVGGRALQSVLMTSTLD